MKIIKITLILAVAATTSCAVNLDKNGDPKIKVDSAALAELIANKVNPAK